MSLVFLNRYSSISHTQDYFIYLHHIILSLILSPGTQQLLGNYNMDTPHVTCHQKTTPKNPTQWIKTPTQPHPSSSQHMFRFNFNKSSLESSEQMCPAGLSWFYRNCLVKHPTHLSSYFDSCILRSGRKAGQEETKEGPRLTRTMHFREILHKNHMRLLFGMLKVVYKGVNSWTHKHHQNSASPQLDYIQPIHSPRSLNLFPFLISKESTHIFHSYHTTSSLHTAGLQWFIPQNVF